MTRNFLNNLDGPVESRIWIRGGKGPYYCKKCSFVTPYKDWLKQHDKKEHAL